LVYIIAEIGFNHEGNMDKAVDMIRSAAEAGANAVKFQTFRAQDIALSSSPHYPVIESGEMDYQEHEVIFNAAKDFDVEFISTPFSPWAVELLEKLGVGSYKVASMDCTNQYLLGYIAQTRKPIYLSTGMATLDEIAEILNYLNTMQSGPVSLLHCISMYPAGEEHLNLEIIPFLGQLFNVPVGYSDHYPGTKACLAAAMLGAEIIETHFTLDASRKGGDHFHSVEPDALKVLIADIHLFNKMQGNSVNIFNRPDRSLSVDYRRGLYTARKLAKGKILKTDDFLMCRPATELSPNDILWLTGKTLHQDLPPHVTIERKHIKSKKK
jgi:N,N'-diacetyllegionaminate synthase